MTRGRQHLLQVKPILARHPDVKDETCAPRVVAALEKSARRRVRLDPVTHGSEQPGETSPDGWIIVDDGNDYLALDHAELLPAPGSEKWTVAPDIELSTAQMSPP